MNEYSGYIDRLEQDDKRKKVIIAVVVGVLVLTFLTGTVWGLKKVLKAEGTLETVPVMQVIPQELTNESGILGYFSDALKNAFSDPDAAKVGIATYFELDGEKISIGESDADNALEKELAYAKTAVLDNIKKYDFYADRGTEFGEELSSFTVPVLFTPDEADITLELGKKNDEGVLENTDKYYFKAVFGEYAFKELPDEIGKSFNLDGDRAEAVVSQLTSDFSPVAMLRGSNVVCSNFEISADFNTDTGRINGVCYSRLYEVTLDIEFTGELERLGEKTLSFPLRVYEIHTFTYAGIELKNDELWLKKGATEVIEVIKTHGPDGMNVAFASSDKSIAAVNENGYVKGVRYSNKPVSVTITAEYRGHVYEKTCTVYVRHEVEGVELERDAVSLGIGESLALVPVFKPKAGIFSKAPEFTTVKWYVGTDSDGKSYSDAVKIDENGVVTVIGDNGAHFAEVFCVTDDGHFKATCEITIK